MPRRCPDEPTFGVLHNGTLLAVPDGGRHWADDPPPEVIRLGAMTYQRQADQPGYVYHAHSNGYTIVQVIVPATVDEEAR